MMSLNRYNVLLVEDDPVLLDLLTSIFSEFNVDIVAVRTASEGLSLLEVQSWKVIMTDVRTPGGISGFELAKQAERLHPEATLIISSGYYDVSERPALQRAIFLAKPWNLNVLLAHLAAALARFAR